MSNQTQINNINDLIANLAHVYEELRDGAMKNKDAAELANVAGKVISANKVQLVYHALRKEQPTIPFLAAPVETLALPQQPE